MNNQLSFDINCKYASVSPNTGNSVTVTIDDCDKSDLLDLVKNSSPLSEIISHMGESEILDSIGIDSVKRYFDLTEGE